MLKLYYAPDNASLAVRLALEEGQIPYETNLVNRAVGGQKKPECLAVNPTGLIPALETPEGILAETAACLLWLSDSFPDRELGPPVHHIKRGIFLRWLFYLSNTVHADLRRLFYARRFVPPGSLEDHHRIMVGHLRGHFDILDNAVSDEPGLFAPPSALALYAGPLLRWAALYPVSADRWLSLSDYPALEALVLALEARPSVPAVAEAEGLGPSPFSKPGYPNPPEGSAL